MPEKQLGVIAPTRWTERLKQHAKRFVHSVELEPALAIVLQSREREQAEQRLVRSALVIARPDVWRVGNGQKPDNPGVVRSYTSPRERGEVVSHNKMRVLLDANVWRHLADSNDGQALESLCRRQNLTVLVSPSVVYEALRTRDEDLRARLARMLTRPAWTTLMPEAYEESSEFLEEVRRLRPEWLRRSPVCPVRERNRIDWLPTKGSFWDRVRRTPHRAAEHVRSIELDTMDVARNGAHRWREEARDAGWTVHGTDVTSIVARYEHPLPGWDGSDVPAWRVSSLSWASRAFLTTPYSDWLGELVDFRHGQLVRDASWHKFWLHDVDAARTPRWWIRGACEILQSVRTVTGGTPGDQQLATYMFSCDYFITHDRVFADILERCRQAASSKMGIIAWVSSDGMPSKRALEAIGGLHRGRDFS